MVSGPGDERAEPEPQDPPRFQDIAGYQQPGSTQHQPGYD